MARSGRCVLVCQVLIACVIAQIILGAYATLATLQMPPLLFSLQLTSRLCIRLQGYPQFDELEMTLVSVLAEVESRLTRSFRLGLFACLQRASFAHWYFII